MFARLQFWPRSLSGVRFPSNFNFDDRPVSEFKGSQQNFDAIKCNNMLIIFYQNKKENYQSGMFEKVQLKYF